MSRERNPDQTWGVHRAPSIPGVTFRRFGGEVDYPSMVEVLRRSRDADRIVLITSLDQMKYSFKHLVNCDPYKDMLMVEVKGNLAGYCRVWWEDRTETLRIYEHSASLVPEWRKRGLRRAMLLWNEGRLREIAMDHPQTKSHVFEVWSNAEENDWKSLIINEGYKPVRHEFDMVLPSLDNILDFPLPSGLEVRRPLPEHYRAIWEARREVAHDEWDYRESMWSEERYKEWIESPSLMPNLWQIAWDGNGVAGMVLSFIDEEENKQLGRKWGHVWDVYIRRPWRGRGLAHALIARVLKMFKEKGMTAAILDVDAENPSGAVRLYGSLGFQIVNQWTHFRKPLYLNSKS